MSSFPILPRIVLVAAIALSVTAGAKSFMNSSATKAAKQEVRIAQDYMKAKDAEIAKMKSDAEAASAALEATITAKTEVEAKLKEATDELAATQKEVTEIKAVLAEQAEGFEEMQDKLAEIEARGKKEVDTTSVVDELKEKLAEAEERATEAEKELASVQSRLASAEGQKQILEEDAARRREKVGRPGVEGRVTAVNSNWNFAILNLGDRHGISSGTPLLVKRGDTLVARLKVSSVEPSSSVADIESASKDMAIEPGDTVIFAEL